MEERRAQVPFLLLPFWLFWQGVVWLVQLTGRLAGVLVGLALMASGIILMITVIGAFLGIPFMILGLLVTLRSIF